MSRWDVVPMQKVGRIEFGMTRRRVRDVLESEFDEFRKGLGSDTTDDFGFVHVYYDDNGECTAVELFQDCYVYVAGNIVFPASVEEVKQVIPDMKEESGSYISKTESVGLYAPDSQPEAILFGAKGYYDGLDD